MSRSRSRCPRSCRSPRRSRCPRLSPSPQPSPFPPPSPPLPRRERDASRGRHPTRAPYPLRTDHGLAGLDASFQPSPHRASDASHHWERPLVAAPGAGPRQLHTPALAPGPRTHLHVRAPRHPGSRHAAPRQEPCGRRHGGALGPGGRARARLSRRVGIPATPDARLPPLLLAVGPQPICGARGGEAPQRPAGAAVRRACSAVTSVWLSVAAIRWGERGGGRASVNVRCGPVAVLALLGLVLAAGHAMPRRGGPGQSLPE